MPAPESPATPPTHAGRTPRWRGMALLLVAIGILVTFFRGASGSMRSELGSHPDEAAHYVTGLMVRDYVASGFHESPLRYADDYYRHYPKIGLGNWPPVFYIVQAAWMLAVGSTVTSVLILIGMIGIALAMMTAWSIRLEYGWTEAALGALLLTALPLVQQYTNMVMAEVLVALLMFGAAGCFACYMENVNWKWAVGFGICAGLAIMTKGTGLALVFVPPMAIIFTRRYELLRERALWGAALLVAVIAGPWTWHFRNIGRGGWEEASPSLHFTRMAIGYYGWQMVVALGGLVAALALAGGISLFLPKTRKRPIAICSLALVLGVWIFQTLTPVGLEARHLMPAMPGLIVLAVAGLHAVTGRCRPGVRAAVGAGVLAVFFGWPTVFPPAGPAPGYGSLGNQAAVSPFRIPRKQWGGYEPITGAALKAGPGKKVLVASDARGEGMFIAEVAAHDPHRPSYIIERASKLLATSEWSGASYQGYYQTPDQVRDAVAKAGIALVVIDSSPEPLPPHEKLLVEAIATPVTTPLLSSPAVRDGKISEGAINLYIAPARPTPAAPTP